MTYIDHKLYVFLGESLRDARDLANMTLSDVAKSVGVTTMTIQRYEKAERKATVETVRKLCAVYGVDADELMQHSIDRFRSFSSNGPVFESLSSDESELLFRYRNLNSSGQKRLSEYAMDLESSGRYV